ncbi:MAG TPA: ribosome maturation factor RimM [Candidatus Acidoferrales bacterium]|nr:ribosome maturation factor RimM [Candidatus Acidoferrales bacterium]
MPSHGTERLTLALVLRPHGRRGEVAAEILTDFPERLTKLKQVWLWDGRAAEPRKAEVRRCWLSPGRGGQAIFHFAGSESIDDAEKLRGLQVQVPMEQRTKLPAGSYYISELTGCEVWEAGTMLGVVRGVQMTGTPVLEVDTANGEVLVPMAEEICRRIDVAARRIDAVLPEGLRDLNKK